MGDSFTKEETEGEPTPSQQSSAEPEGHPDPSAEGGAGQLRIPEGLADEDVMSLHDDALTGRLTFEARQSWSGGVIDDQNDDPLMGTTLHDTYRVGRVIGEGGMGRVYEAHHTRIASKRYALKVLHAEFARNPEIRTRFQQEAEAAAKIEHSGVVGIYDVGETPDGGPYMVCEYLVGEDLNDYLTEYDPMPAPTVVHVGRQLCSALAAAHERGVIHRDLKPHNVFILGDEGPPENHAALQEPVEFPTIKVLDFGLSQFVERDSDLTKTGIILGTPGYMAPEQASGLATDHRTDIYGIGALLYAAATGRAPFKEDSPQKTVLSVLSQMPARPRELVASIPLGLEIVIQRAMARDPDERYQSVAEMEQALAQLAAPAAPHRPATALPGAPPVAPRLQLGLTVLAALVLGLPSLALAGAALLQSRGVDYLSFRPSVLEWLLLVLLALVLLFPLGLLARHLRRHVYRDSARVAGLLPKIQGPLVAALLAYGVSALVALSVWAVDGLRAGGLGRTAPSSALTWYVVLPVNALLAASVVAIRRSVRRSSRPFFRALCSVGYPAGASLAGLFLLLISVLQSVPSNDGPTAVSESGPAKATRSAKAVPSRKAPRQKGAPDGDETKDPDSDAQSKSGETRERAPSEELALAQEEGPQALETLLSKYPRDGRILEALVLSHASRADTLEQSVQAISRLFSVEPTFSRDPDMLFILKKGLLARGDAHATAFSVVKDQMGTEGGELVYELMGEHPKQHDRLKNVFLALRKSDQVTPATAIAFDLRYASSCKGRLELLERARQEGDLRSVSQLRALSTAPKKCGWGRKCRPPCPAEAARFRQTATAIRERLDGR